MVQVARGFEELEKQLYDPAQRIQARQLLGREQLGRQGRRVAVVLVGFPLWQGSCRMSFGTARL